MANVQGTNNTGGFVGNYNNTTSGTNIENCYSSGAVNATGNNNGMFYGSISSTSSNTPNNVFANNEQPEGISTTQTSVEGHEKSWFGDSNNLSFLGSAYL